MEEARAQPRALSPADPLADSRELESAVEAVLSRRSWRLRFTPPLEAAFERETQTARWRHLLVCGFLGLAVYLTFLISDYDLARARFGEALFVRLGVVTPAYLAVLIMTWSGVGSRRLHESLHTAAILLVGLSIVYLVNLDDPDVAAYDSGLLLYFAFCAIVVRLQAGHTLFLVLAVSSAFVANASWSGGQVTEVMQHNMTAMVAGALFMVFASYALERERRRTYLYRVRDRIHTAELRESNRQLTLLSHLDPLTGVANRRHLDETLESLCRGAGDEPFGLIMIDIDFFKPYNDTYGHNAGDDCLRRVAGILQALLRLTDDRLARFGGEEFIAVLPATGPSETIEVASRIIAGVRELGIPHRSSKVATVVTISAGVTWISSAREPEAVMAEADEALYRAKSDGRNRFAVAPLEALEARADRRAG